MNNQLTNTKTKVFWTLEVKTKRYGWQQLPGEILTRADVKDLLVDNPQLRATRHEVTTTRTSTWQLETFV